jgi:hypothetical protein
MAQRDLGLRQWNRGAVRIDVLEDRLGRRRITPLTMDAIAHSIIGSAEVNVALRPS